MSTPPPSPAPDGRKAGMTRANRRILLLLLLVTLAPVVASYTAYYLLPRDKQTNYGELLATRPAPDVRGTRDGKPASLADWRGKWLLVVAAPGACDPACAKALYAMRQARTIQGREMDRVQRVWLVTDAAAVPPALVAEHPDLAVLVAPEGLAGFPAGAMPIYLVDPLGNLVLAWPRDPDIKALARDISRLLRASRIG